jgi:putative hemin transport protein
MNLVVDTPPTDLPSRWAELLTVEPRLRIRDAAERLGVSEAELLLVDPDSHAVPLSGDWLALLGDVATLGTVMALTRNDHAVIEKVGTYAALEGNPHAAVLINKPIDLRIFARTWAHGFAVRTAKAGTTHSSLQFFDAYGTAMHKIYLKDPDMAAAFDAFITRWQKADVTDTPHFQPRPAILPAGPAPDGLDVQALRTAWQDLRDVHDFFGMLRTFNIPRLRAMEVVGTDLAWPLPVSAFRTALARAAEQQVPVMVFVGNRGCIEIHSGPIERVEIMGPWANILDPGFNLHVREDHIAAVWAVRKPTEAGFVTSIELYDANGENFLILLGERKPGQTERTDWRAVAEGLQS